MSQHKRLRRLNEFPSYKGGDTIVVNDYILEYQPHHQDANFWGYVQQHRLVAADKIGRPLRRDEAVHHLDHCRSHNHPDNLEVMDRTAHLRMHARMQADKNRIRLTEDQVRAALDGRTLKDAARILNCSQESLRNWFPDLLRPRTRTSPTCIDDPRDLARVLEVATDPRVGLHECAKELRMSISTVLRICERHGVPWVKKSRKNQPKRMYAAEDWGAVAATRSARNGEVRNLTAAEVDTVLALAQDRDVGILEAVLQTGIARGTIYRICKENGVQWQRRDRHPHGYEPTDDELAKILAAAANPRVSMETLLAQTKLSQNVIQRVLKQHHVKWVRYNERPTLRASAIYASPPEPVEQ